MSDQINRNEPTKSSSYELLSKRINEIKINSKKKPVEAKPEQQSMKVPQIKNNPGTNNLKMKKVLIVFAGIISAVLVAVLVLGVYFLTYKPNNNIPRETTNPAIDTSNTDTETGSDTQSETESETAVPVINPGDLERKNDCYNFLIMGKDNVAYNTDVIFLLSYNVADGEIAILQIPRDTYIEIQGKSVKINSTYARMYSAARRAGKEDLMKAAMEDTANTFGANLNIVIDYYVLVNLDGVGAIVDLIGGVPMNVPYDMKYSDPGQNLYIDLKAGQQVLNGSQAQQFIRFRSGYLNADIGRIEAQKYFMTAFIKQVKDNMNLSTLVNMLGKLYENIYTNVSISDLTYFVKCFSTVQNTSIRFVTFPTGYKSPYVQMMAPDMINILERFFNITTTPITSANFDPYKIFVNQGDSEALRIYNTTASDISVYVRNAQDIDENGITVPLRSK